MRTQIQDHLNTGSKNTLIFIAAMVVGVMAYTGELGYTPVVLLLLLLAVGVDRYGSS